MGMRNPLDSWDRSDTVFTDLKPFALIGPNDRSLMERLLNAGGNEHCKFRRMLAIWCKVTGPFYWWKQMDTYKVGTVANSCSTMHTLAKNPLTIDMFSTDRLSKGGLEELKQTVERREGDRRRYVKHMAYAKEYEESNPELARTHRKQAQGFWNDLVKLLPESFNQTRTLSLNYEVMAAIYRQRKNHKLKEWHDFIDAMVEELPYPWIFTGEAKQ